MVRCKKNIYIIKTKFSQINNKRFYFLNGITILPIGHPSLSTLTKYKEEKGKKKLKLFS